MELFSKTELIVMASVLGSVLLIIIILTILDFIDEKKERKLLNSVSKKDMKLEEKEVVTPCKSSEVVEEIEVLDFDEPVIEMKKENTDNEAAFNDFDSCIIDDGIVSYEDIAPSKDDKILVVEKSEEEKKKNALMMLASIKEELSKEEELYENTITNFELEQEENAIISYDELVKVSDKLYSQNEIVQYDDGDEPITIDEVIKRFSNNEMNFENTADYDKLNEKIDSDVKLIESFKQN